MKLKKEELNYINQYKNKLSIDAMAKKLNRSVATVKKHVLKFREEEQKKLADELFVEEVPDNRIKPMDLMSNNNKGAISMTEAASMHADEALKRQNKLPSARYKNCIKVFRPNEPIK